MRANTRDKLLTAAEGIIVQFGVNALSVRKIGDAAGLNPTLVTYHFGTLYALLDELCSLNLEPILAEWHKIRSDDEGQTLDDVLRAWLAPMFHPARFTPGGRALVVLDEIAAHGEAALKETLLTAMEQFAVHLHRVLKSLVPQLSEHELRARLRFIAGAALGPPPRIHAVACSDGNIEMNGLAYLLPFARASLGN